MILTDLLDLKLYLEKFSGKYTMWFNYLVLLTLLVATPLLEHWLV